MTPALFNRIAEATRTDVLARNQIPDRLLELCSPLARGALRWLVVSVTLMVFAIPFGPNPLAVIVIVTGAAALAWSIVLASFATSFFIGHPRVVRAWRSPGARRDGGVAR